MPIDFRTYTDPGVYIETITPPVVFTAAIEPTILAIVGSSPTTREAFESTTLTEGTASDLVTLGGDPETISVKDRLLGTQYVSGAVGVLAALVDIADTSWTNSVTTFDNVTLPVEDNRVQIVELSGYNGTDTFKFTLDGDEVAGAITRGTDHTAAGIKANLETHADIPVNGVNVYTNVDASVFAVEFVNPITEIGLLTITSGTGGTTGLVSNGFLALVDEEVVGVTASAEGTAQTWTVVRGIQGTDAQHLTGAVVNVYEGYSTYPSVPVAELAQPISSTDTTFDVNKLYGVQDVDLGDFAAADQFTITYGGQTTAAITYAFYIGTSDPHGFIFIKDALEALTTVARVQITSLTDTNTPAADPNAGFRVRFLDPNSDVTALTITPTGFTSGGITNRGVADDTYLDVEGERMLVASVSGTAPQTLTVVRGVNGTVAASHGEVDLYENTGADYTVASSVGEDDALLTSDDVTSLLSLGTRISTGSLVNVSLEATDEAQFSTGLFDDLDTIRDKYGDPLDANGQINSELTLGAQLALANGATQLVLVATNPADVTASDPNGIQAAIAKLAFEQSVNSLAVLSGTAGDITYAKGHVEQMSEQGLLRRAFVGVSSSPTYLSTQFISKAGQLNSERVSLVAPSQFKVDNGTGTPIIVSGYFAAAAVAGLQAGQTPQEPLTRKQVFGFVGINDQDSSQNIFLMQAAGVLVVFEDRFGRLIIKHGLTTDMTSVYTREISVITSRDRLRDFILETLEGGALVGSPMTAETPNLVMAAVNSALEESTRQGLIFDYSDVKYRFPTENPTMIQVRFSYKPTLPLNYIHVQFSIDTSTGTVEFQSINDNTSIR